MLKGLNPILGPQLLFTLRAMGHGDEIALVDGNYPGEEHGRRLVRADGHGVTAVLDAILSVLPVDDMAEEAMFRACPGGDVSLKDPVHAEMEAICRRHEPERRLVPLSGDAFYARVRAAHSVVQTSEPRLFGNIILRKGVIHPA
jgi:L-fucose mutarotase